MPTARRSKLFVTRGFTLLEVMVALAVAAIGLAAISKSMITSVDVATKLKQRTVASWVASNHVASLRMERRFGSSGGEVAEVEMASTEWRIVEARSSTPDPNISRVDVSVYAAEKALPSATLTAYLGRYLPAQPDN